MGEARDLVDADRLVFTGYVSDASLAALLRAAATFAYPSLYEGLGLPLIQTMACGAPVVASDTRLLAKWFAMRPHLVPARDPAAWGR
jgi:alpha-1,3-rhamnosyl/mannosyltransferase